MNETRAAYCCVAQLLVVTTDICSCCEERKNLVGDALASIHEYPPSPPANPRPVSPVPAKMAALPALGSVWGAHKQEMESKITLTKENR